MTCAAASVYTFQRVLVFASFPALSTERFSDLYHTLTPNTAAWMLSIIRPLSTVFLWRVLVDLFTVFEACLALHQRRVEQRHLGTAASHTSHDDGLGPNVADIHVSAACFTAPGFDPGAASSSDGSGDIDVDDDEWQIVTVQPSLLSHDSKDTAGVDPVDGGAMVNTAGTAGIAEEEAETKSSLTQPVQALAVTQQLRGDDADRDASNHRAPQTEAASGAAVVVGPVAASEDDVAVMVAPHAPAARVKDHANPPLRRLRSGSSRRRRASQHQLYDRFVSTMRGGGGALIGVFIVGWLMALEVSNSMRATPKCTHPHLPATLQMYDENDQDDRCIVISIQVVTVMAASVMCIGNLVIERRHWQFKANTANVVLLVSAFFSIVSHVLDLFRELPRCPTIIVASIVWIVSQTALVFNRRAWPALLAFLLFLNLGWTFSTLLLEAHHMEQAVEQGHELNVELFQVCIFWLTLEYHVAVTEVVLERILLPLMSSLLASIVTQATAAATGHEVVTKQL